MKWMAIVLVMFLCICGGFMTMKDQSYRPSKGEQLVNSILNKTAAIIKNKYGIRPCGEGATMPGGPVQGLMLCFNTTHPLTKKELRKLVIESAHTLMSQVNENREIQEFLKNKPFTILNVEIIIYNHDKNGREVFDPGISVAQTLQGNLMYCTTDKSDTFRFEKCLEETYEDALKALQEDSQD